MGNHFFIAPKHVGFGVVFFGDEALREAGGFDGFGIEYGQDFDAGLAGEFGEERFGVDLILRGINDDSALRVPASSKNKK
jgi:hypothetical protein